MAQVASTREHHELAGPEFRKRNAKNLEFFTSASVTTLTGVGKFSKEGGWWNVRPFAFSRAEWWEAQRGVDR